jgi:hypothetical protein
MENKTLNQLVYIIHKDLNGGFGGSNERLSTDQLESEIHLMRGRVAMEMHQKIGMVDEGMYQTLKNLSLKKRDPIEPDCEEEGEECEGIWHTFIPLLMDLNGKRMVSAVTNPDRSVKFRVRYGLEDRYWMHEKLTAKMPTAIIDGLGLWLFNAPKAMEKITIRGIWDNPQDAWRRVNNDPTKEFRNEPYPCSAPVADMITGKILEGKIRNAVRIRPDLINTQTDKN